MPTETVEVELRFDLADYIRATTRLLFTQPTFVGILALTALAVIYAMYVAIRDAGAMGFGQALWMQAPILLFLLVPIVLWFSLRRQGARIIARQRASNERIFYVFSDDGFVQRVISDHGRNEHSGTWDTFAKVVETPHEFLLLLPRQGGVFLPKRCFASPDQVARFRDMVGRALGDRAKLRSN